MCRAKERQVCKAKERQVCKAKESQACLVYGELAVSPFVIVYRIRVI